MANKINDLNFDELKRKSFFKLAMLIYLSAILVNIFYVISSYNNNLITSAIVTLFPLIGFCVSIYVLLVKRNYLLGPYIVYIVLGVSTVCLSYLEGLMSGYYWYHLSLIFVLPYVIRHEVYFQKHTNILYSIVILFIIVSILISPMYSVYYEHLTHEQAHYKFILNSLVCFTLTMIFSMQALTHNKSYIKRIDNDKKQAVNEKDRRTKVLSNLGHELRTQINSINGVTQLILEDTSNKVPQTKYFEILDHCNNNMLLLVNDMLDIHKIESGLFELIHEPKVLYGFLSKVTIPFIGKAEEKNLELHSHIDSKLIGLIVSIDEKRLAQVIYNLISNAIKFTEQGRITFSAQLIKLDNDAVEIQFSVLDTGIGIAPENIKKVFESFHQITNEKNPVYGGTGLGLAISQSIVEAMHSEIKIESKINEGTCFQFSLTLKRLAYLPNKFKKEEAYNIDFLMNSSVLLVEDNMISMMYAKKLLEKHVTKIYEATNGVEAISKVKDHSDIDLVFLDLEMPQMNGFKAISHIKEQRPNLIVIAFTANIPSTELINKLDDLGFDNILSKPFSKQDIFEILKKYDKALHI